MKGPRWRCADRRSPHVRRRGSRASCRRRHRRRPGCWSRHVGGRDSRRARPDLASSPARGAHGHRRGRGGHRRRDRRWSRCRRPSRPRFVIRPPSNAIRRPDSRRRSGSRMTSPASSMGPERGAGPTSSFHTRHPPESRGRSSPRGRLRGRSHRVNGRTSWQTPSKDQPASCGDRPGRSPGQQGLLDRVERALDNDRRHRRNAVRDRARCLSQRRRRSHPEWFTDVLDAVPDREENVP